MTESSPKICDYADYDYKTDFWSKGSRDYENQCEQKVIATLLKKIPNTVDTMMDLGCGFGRLFPSYEQKANTIYMADYSQNLLDQAKHHIRTQKNIHFIQANAYELPLQNNTLDLLITVRMLHHIENLEALFKEINRVVKPGGHIIIEIPNKRHFLQIIRFFLGRSKTNPFDSNPYQISSLFFNYHFNSVFSILQKNGFLVLSTRSTSFFRSRFIKKIIPTTVLVFLDTLIQSIFTKPYLTPSIFVFACKVN